MSGLPALRCFIFLAADLIILFLPSFGSREALNQMGQGFTLIYRFKSGWMDELFFQPLVFCKICANGPAGQPRDEPPFRDERTPKIVSSGANSTWRGLIFLSNARAWRGASRIPPRFSRMWRKTAFPNRIRRAASKSRSSFAPAGA